MINDVTKECVRIHAPKVGALGLRLVYLCLEKLQAMKIKEYKIIYGDLRPGELSARVNLEILCGWEPLGGVTGGAGFLAQAMVRRG